MLPLLSELQPNLVYFRSVTHEPGAQEFQGQSDITDSQALKGLVQNCTALLRWPRLLTGVHTRVRNLRLEPWSQTDDDEARVERGRPAFNVTLPGTDPTLV